MTEVLESAPVAVGHNRNRESAERFVAELAKKTRPHGASASAHCGNVGSPEDCRRTISEVIDTQANYAASKSGLFVAWTCERRTPR